MCVLSLADEPVNRGCRIELVAVRFFTFLGFAPPSIKGPEGSDWNDVSKETLKKLLDMEIGQQNHLSNNQKIFYEVGKAGPSDARAATLRVQKNIQEILNK